MKNALVFLHAIAGWVDVLDNIFPLAENIVLLLEPP